MTRTTRTVPLIAMLSLLGASTARPQAGLLVPTSTGRPDPKVLSLAEMTIDVGVARGYARVNVRQIFANHTGTIQEGTYRFGLPPSAAVGDFAVWDDLVRIPGVILEKQRARAIYQELTRQRIDPGLLQQGEEEEGETLGEAAGPSAPRASGGALFSVHVAPIPAFGTKRLELQFQQEVPIIAGKGELRIALRPPDGEPPVAGTLAVRIRLASGKVLPVAGALPLKAEGGDLVGGGSNVALDRDLVLRFATSDAPPLALSAFRNSSGTLPDGLALAPWERPSEIPPEKDGFFLLELAPPAAAGAASAAGATQRAQASTASKRPPVTLALLFDTSLSHRWSGLELAYAHLVRVLDSLRPDDRFLLAPFDLDAAIDAAGPKPATPENKQAALAALRARSLGPGTRVAAAIAAARKVAGPDARLLLLTDGETAGVSSRALTEARGEASLFIALTGAEANEAFRNGATQLLVPRATEIETDLFFERLLAPVEVKAQATVAQHEPPPFTVSLGDPKLRDVYPVMMQPPTPGGLSGWVGRYAVPQARLRWDVVEPLLKGGKASLEAGLPEQALDARDLPRRWARARVDALLLLIEEQGEKKEWIDEIIALSKRYKFVTPYTAFLAAPRSLLRPRQIQPGDPVLRVECDPGTVAVVALFPFGLRLPLVKRPGTNLWEGRFLAPENLKDGRYTVRILLTDVSGARLTESKWFVLDGTAPRITPDALPAAQAGADLRVSVRADEDVIVLTARLGDSPPVPLRWDQKSKRSVGLLHVPPAAEGPAALFFEAVDRAKNHGFARADLEVRR